MPESGAPVAGEVATFPTSPVGHRPPSSRRGPSGKPQWTMRLALAVAAVCAAPAPAEPQSVLVRIVGAETAEPLVGAVAHLVSPTGETLASRLSDQGGRALFMNVEGGRYRVRAEMLGHDAGESDVFDVRAGGSVPIVLRLSTRPIPLAGVEVTAEAGRCTTRPGEQGRLLAAVWEEARKALSATAVAEQQGIYRYALLVYEQTLDAAEVVVDENQARRQSYMRTPFASLAVEDLTNEGFVRRTPSEWTYYAPDAQALLSDSFLDTHCFRLLDGGPSRPDLVGLAFEPTGENEHPPDISGTLWLDRDSVALRWLDYTYENLEPDVRPGDATGRVEFQRLPVGTWIVRDWWIRMPLVEVDVGRFDRRRVTGFRRTGGRVLEVVEAGGRELASQSTGAVEGIVVDSLGLPMRGIRVGWVGSNQTVLTNAEGRFGLVGLTQGTYRVRFADPKLDSLGLEPPGITQDVVGGISSFVEFHMPSPAELLARLCQDVPSGRSAVLAGVVRDAATARPISGAEVRVRWSQIELSGARSGVIGRESVTELQTAADPRGVYRFCAVPRREELRIQVSVDGMVGAEDRVALAGDERSRMHVVSYAPLRAERGAEPDIGGAVTEPVAPVPRDGPFAKSGYVRDGRTGADLDSTLVELRELGMRAVSDSAGRVSFESVPAGEHALRAERAGYAVVEGPLQVAGGQEFVVLLDALEPTTADHGAIVGRVTDEVGQGIAATDIRIDGQPAARGISNAQGRFQIENVAPGLLEVQFERLGYASRTARFVVQPGRTAELAVVLSIRAIELEPIEVRVRSRPLERSGFYARRDRGFGHHFDRAEIERIHPDRLYDLVARAPGVRANDPRISDPTGRGTVVGAPSYAFNPRWGSINTPPGMRPPRVPPGDGTCYLSLYIDDMLMADPDLQQIQPQVIEAVEIYLGNSAPPQYALNSCGAIVVWTRR